jgi:hypothetical protein
LISVSEGGLNTPKARLVGAGMRRAVFLVLVFAIVTVVLAIFIATVFVATVLVLLVLLFVLIFHNYAP